MMSGKGLNNARSSNMHIYRGYAHVFLGTLLVTAIAGCTPVMESSLLGYARDEQSGQPQKCQGALGGYSLSKSYLRVQVVKLHSARPEFVLHEISTEVHPDHRHGFCLDYLASPLAHDQVTVRRNKPAANGQVARSQLLQIVASNTYDQSAFIIRRVIRAVFMGIGNFGTRALIKADQDVKEPVADLTFDPFDARQTATINSSLRKSGFCLILEGHTFNRNLGSADQYCRDPVAFGLRDPQFGAWYGAYDQEAVPSNTPGIVYRPRTAFDLLVYTKDDPRGPEPWRLRKVQPVYFENISPVLALRVDRALFAQKKMYLEFDDGALKKVCIHKTSELKQAIEIPLEVVRAVVRLPTEIIQIQYDQIDAGERLLGAEKDLVVAQKKYIAVLNKQTEAAVSSTRPAAPGTTQIVNTNFTSTVLTPLTPGAADDINNLATCPDPSTSASASGSGRK